MASKRERTETAVTPRDRWRQQYRAERAERAARLMEGLPQARDIREAVRNGYVKLRLVGNGVTSSVTAYLKKLHPEALSIYFSVGMILASIARRGTQLTAIARQKRVRLDGETEARETLETVCLERDKDIPDRGEGLHLRGDEAEPAIVSVLNTGIEHNELFPPPFDGAGRDIQQCLVWLLTDSRTEDLLDSIYRRSFLKMEHYLRKGASLTRWILLGRVEIPRIESDVARRSHDAAMKLLKHLDMKIGEISFDTARKDRLRSSIQKYVVVRSSMNTT